MKPSNSTVASVGIGVPLATILAWVVSQFGVAVPGEVQAALGAVISAAVGYLFLGGKRVDTEEDSPASPPTNKQSGHATLMFLTFLAMTFALLTACASLGLQTPKTFDERYAYARQETIAVRESCTASLDARLITSADNAYCLEVADRSSSLLTIAREAQRLGDIATADSRLALVSGVLAELETYLQSRASK